MPSPVVGVAAVSRKLYNPAMQALLASVRRYSPRLRLVFFDDDVLCRPPTTWPRVHVLLTLYSTHFPLDNVLRYVHLRNPVLINNLYLQPLMMDRRHIRHVLERADVPTPPALVLDRARGDYACQSAFSPNTLVVHSPTRHESRTIHKPFVEKPVDADDHNVYIYYKNGGVRKLFRKVTNKSSAYYPNETAIRQHGDYVYEKFYEPEKCADVKVYAVGNYFHAESRKAPHIDGIVDRDGRGRERRTEILLSEQELQICRRVASAFDQFVIGFDLLRGPASRRFIIDVNGWSLVKNSDAYAVKAGKLLAERIEHTLKHKPRITITNLPSSPLSDNDSTDSDSDSTPDVFDTTQPSNSTCLA